MIDRQYEDLLEQVLENGQQKSDRTGTGILSVFGRQLRYDLSKGFPLITTKKVYFKGVVGELLWFLKGSTNTKWLVENNIHIWDEWADEQGNLGPVYGAQWRSWPSTDGQRAIDQIANLLNDLRTNPDSRRMLVSAWNVSELKNMALPPCHAFFQCYVRQGKLSLQIYQRSCDLFLGVPFNIASYALLTHLLAQQADLEVGDLIWTGGDCHIYLNHIEQVQTQLKRDPYPFPTLQLKKADCIDAYDFTDISLDNYKHHLAIKAQVAV